MNPIDLIGRGVGVATGAVRVATAVPRLALNLLINRDGDDDGTDPFAAAQTIEADDAAAALEADDDTRVAPPSAGAAGRAPGGTGRRAPSPRATPGRAKDSDGAVEVTTGPPEPTSAAGASGGVAGTADAPGDAAKAGAPDPTAATAANGTPGPSIPQGERRANDVRPQPSRRKTADTEETLVETEGAATPGPQIRVDAPFDGYDKMKAGEIVSRVKGSDDSTKAVVRLYESTHKKRKSILDATT